MSNKRLLIIGVSGVTCGGKTTLATTLNKTLPRSKVISQDDYFLQEDDPRHTWIKELNHINFDILTSLDMSRMHSDITKLIENRNLLLPRSITTNKNTKASIEENCKHIQESDVEILVIEGFCIFNYKPLLDLFGLKYYFTLSEVECRNRRNKRTYDPPDCSGYFEKCVWPEHLKQLKEVQEEVEDVVYFDDGYPKEALLGKLLQDIVNLL